MGMSLVWVCVGGECGRLSVSGHVLLVCVSRECGLDPACFHISSGTGRDGVDLGCFHSLNWTNLHSEGVWVQAASSLGLLCGSKKEDLTRLSKNNKPKSRNKH